MIRDATSLTALFPHQRALLADFFAVDAAQDVYLSAPPGMGKTRALVALVGELMARVPAARILWLDPFRALVLQIAERLRLEGVTVITVDRFRYRQLLEAEGDAPWPRGAVYALTTALAGQSDVREKLVEFAWDLVICDEASLLDGKMSRLVQELRTRSARTILLAPITGPAAPSALARSMKVIEWKPGELYDDDGGSLGWPRPEIHRVRYSEADPQLLLPQRMTESVSLEPAQRNALLEALESSPAAFEELIASTVIGQDDQNRDEETSLGEVSPDVVRLLGRTLQRVEEGWSPQKLGSLLPLVRRAIEAGGRVVVVTKFVATAYYLASALDAEGLRTGVLTRQSDPGSREETIDCARRGETVLVSTRASLAWGPDLPQVTDLVFYEPLGDADLAYAIIGHANSLARTEPLRVHVLERT